MNPKDDSVVLGRRGFLRSAALLGTGAGITGLVGACSDDGPAAGDAGWMHVETTNTSTGTTTSVDALFDVSAEPGTLTTDAMFCGRVVTATGLNLPLCLTLPKEYANGLDLRAVSGDLHHLLADGVPQPPGAPYEIRFVEHIIPGTTVTVATGQLVDPTHAVRVNFTITHDPSWFVPAFIVVSAAAICLVCLAQAQQNSEIEIYYIAGLCYCRRRHRQGTGG